LNGFIPRILVADNHYLIALEAQRIISEARACSVEICRRDDLAKALTPHYDLVFVDAAPTCQAQKQQAEMIIAARAGLVFIHAGHLEDQGCLKEKALAIFEKPFNEEEIHHFIRTFAFSGKPGSTFP
jgi:nicotinate-nucleotide pyrophosphorylase